MLCCKHFYNICKEKVNTYKKIVKLRAVYIKIEVIYINKNEYNYQCKFKVTLPPRIIKYYAYECHSPSFDDVIFIFIYDRLSKYICTGNIIHILNKIDESMYIVSELKNLEKIYQIGDTVIKIPESIKLGTFPPYYWDRLDYDVKQYLPKSNQTWINGKLLLHPYFDSLKNKKEYVWNLTDTIRDPNNNDIFIICKKNINFSSSY